MKQINFYTVLTIFLCAAIVGCAPPLYQAAEKGDIDAVKQLIAAGADIDQKSEGQFNPLKAASRAGHIEIVKFLLDNGADVNPKSGSWDFTPLSVAASYNHNEIVNLLIDKGADVNKAITILNRVAGGKEAVELLKEIKKEKAANKLIMPVSKTVQEVHSVVKSDIDKLPAVAAAPKPPQETSPVVNFEISGITADKALVMGNIEAPKKIIVFTDPDCRPYCEKFHHEIQKIIKIRSDIVFYIKLYPLKNHRDAYWKSKSIICNNSLKLLEDNFNNKEIPNTDCDTNEIDSNIKLAEELGINGVPALILPDGTLHFGFATADKLIAKIDSSIKNISTAKAEIITSKSAQKVPPPKSDVDELPSIKTKLNKSSYAIVIGIENYRQKLPKADFAASDAKVMSEYLTKVMGYPEENIITLTNENATNVDIVKYIEEWLPKNIEPNSSVFIYYSGHGAPNPKTGDAFIVPYDGDPNFIEKTGYPLKKLYDNLSKLPAKEIIVALDSCFSGAGGRSVLAQGSRPLVMNLQTTLAPAKNMIIMAASSGSETSSTYIDKGHGLFTYFLLKGIKGEADTNQDGKIDVDELYQYLKPQVQKIARRIYNNEQSPTLIAPTELLRVQLR